MAKIDLDAVIDPTFEIKFKGHDYTFNLVEIRRKFDEHKVDTDLELTQNIYSVVRDVLGIELDDNKAAVAWSAIHNQFEEYAKELMSKKN